MNTTNIHIVTIINRRLNAVVNGSCGHGRGNSVVISPAANVPSIDSGCATLKGTR